MARRPSSPRPILCAVLDGDALGDDPRGLAAALLAAGVDWIQLRDRKREAVELLELVRALVAARDDARASARSSVTVDARANPADRAREQAPRVLVNKRTDVALAAGADGVHLGLDALDARSVEQLSHGLLLGASLHSIAELEAIIADGVPLAYAQLAPIWAPRSKPAERPALGLERLARAARIAAEAGIPLLAQGGLDAARAGQAVAAGAAGVAVTGIISLPRDPAAAARALRRTLDAAAPLEPDVAEASQ